MLLFTIETIWLWIIDSFLTEGTKTETITLWHQIYQGEQKKTCNNMWMLLTPENFWYHMDSVWVSEMLLPEWFGSLRYALPPPACFNEVRYFLSENNRVGNFVCLFKTLAMTFYVIFVIELLQWTIRLNLIWLERKRNLLYIRCCCSIFKCKVTHFNLQDDPE